MILFIKQYINRRKSKKISEEIFAGYRYASRTIDRILETRTKMFESKKRHLSILISYHNNFYLNPFGLKHAEETASQDSNFYLELIGKLEENLSKTELRIEYLKLELQKLKS